MTSGTAAARERRSDDLRQRRVSSGIAAERDLVPLFAFLIDAENADVADVVMAAGVHASRDVQADVAEIVQIVDIVEALLNRLRDRNRLRVRERTDSRRPGSR